MSSDHSVNPDELSKPAAAFIEKIEAALSRIQPETEIRTWFRRSEQCQCKRLKEAIYARLTRLALYVRPSHEY